MSGRAGFSAGNPPALVEREGELAAVTRALDDLCDGRGSAIIVDGEAGLGKSRLLAEAATLAASRPVQLLRARAGRNDRDLPAAVLTRLISPYLARHPDSREQLFSGTARLARPLLLGGDDGDGGAAAPPAPFAALHGLYWLLLNIAATEPLLLCVDDLQWCDDTTVALLLYLVDRIEDVPIVLLAAARPRRRGLDSEPLRALRGARGVTTLQLQPLSAAGIEGFLAASGGASGADVRSACAEVTGGNPFYLQELLIALDRDDHGGAGTTVEQVRSLGHGAIAHASLSRLARCDQRCVRLAEALAVAGGHTSLPTAAALAGLSPEEAARAADDLAAEQLVTSGPVLDFVHPLIRDAIYSEIAPAARALAHADAARLLQAAGATANEVAAQLLLAPASGDPSVVVTLRQAAGSSGALGAPASAARLLHRALAEGATESDLPSLLIELAAAENAAGLPGACDHARSALDRATDAATRTAAIRVLARALADDNRSDEAASELERGLDELDANSSGAERAGLLGDYLAYAAFLPGMRQRSHLRAAAALESTPEPTTAEGRALLAVLAMRSGQSGEPSSVTRKLAADAWGDGALLSDGGPDSAGWLMVAWALDLAEDWAGAIRICAAAERAATRTGSLQAFVTASYFRGFAHYRRGALRQAAGDTEQAIAACSESTHRYLIAAMVQRAHIELDRAQLGAAAEALDAADARRGVGMLEVPWRLHARGRLALAEHDPQRAAEYCEQAGAYLTERLDAPVTVLPWRVDGGLAALRAGNRDRARELAQDELALATRAELALSRGRALRLLGLVTGGDDGVALLEEAVGVLDGTEAALEAAAARSDLGAALRRGGHPRDARVPLLAALSVAECRGAEALAGTVRNELVAAGSRPPSPRRGPDEPLTPGQRRVAELAARGLSNVEIAQELFVTPKTVEYHLSQVYQRLQITGRRRLAAALAGSAPGSAAE